jgi:REP element-mobilizing transposase RayT
MKYNPDIHHRRSIRLKGYVYSQKGYYFVTICIQNRECLLGQLINNTILLNDAGLMVQNIWKALPDHYPGVGIDSYIIMPNHIHGIIILTVGAGHCACSYKGLTIQGQPRGVAPTMKLSDVIHRFKSLTTTIYRQSVIHHNWPSFPGKLWQRNYYDHIIRNDQELNQIREYIINNPLKWETDEENPVNLKKEL